MHAYLQHLDGYNMDSKADRGDGMNFTGYVDRDASFHECRLYNMQYNVFKYNIYNVHACLPRAEA